MIRGSSTSGTHFRPGLKAFWRAGLAAALLSAMWLGGLLWFVQSLEGPSGAETVASDGVVVLTGGSRRISAALDLIAPSDGKRLLITGVHENTGRDALRRVAGGQDKVFDCCVDIDRLALDTVGNARQAAQWARGHGYRSLTVVTAIYHMPRSLFEFKRVMPDVELVAHPVYPGTVGPGRMGTWRAVRVIALEYNKYLLSLLRARSIDERPKEIAS
ncbi:MAG: YdcF family protein [Sphingomonadales bacterium]